MSLINLLKLNGFLRNFLVYCFCFRFSVMVKKLYKQLLRSMPAFGPPSQRVQDYKVRERDFY